MDLGYSKATTLRSSVTEFRASKACSISLGTVTAILNLGEPYLTDLSYPNHLNSNLDCYRQSNLLATTVITITEHWRLIN